MQKSVQVILILMISLMVIQNLKSQNFVSNQRPSKGSDRMAAFKQQQILLNEVSEWQYAEP